MEQKILEYKNLQLLYESSKTLVYRAVKIDGEGSVILKFIKEQHNTLSDISRLVHSYEITKNLELPGIIKALRVEKQNKRPVLILEDVGGYSLKDYLEQTKIDIFSFLKMAISLANTLGDIHHRQIIHKDIKPANIIIDPETKKVYINDFGISTRLSRESSKLINRYVLEGTLNYISPEQTGRMNREIDYRTDIYSLGVTFYEILTSRLPFDSHDSLELIHFHLARPPQPPHEIDPTIPKAISDIIMKCLAKMPEDRYHSAYGLKNDLEECLLQLEQYGEITHFTAGKKDIYDVFQVPQILYGRKQEIETLLETFSRICKQGSECIIISGYSGVGKTSLINEVQKPIVKQRGYFVTGKFDQLKQDIPYSGLIEALKDLINQALTESETDLTILRHKLLGVLHNSGQILIDLIPGLELIIGKQQIPASLGTQENQNRLKLLFKNFIRVFSKKEHPLVIFLDDLQWAGLSTLVLMKELITDPTIEHLLFIGTYRDQEVTKSHPLILTLEEIRKEKGILHELFLKPLDLEAIKNFTADTMHSSLERATPLAQILHQKSGGNPFYLIQFLKKLHQENYFYFDSNLKIWDWDLEKIQQLEIAENVIDLLEKKIQELPLKVQSILGVAAAIGRSFDLRLLAYESNLSPSMTLKLLWQAVTEEIIQPIGENYRFVESKELENINANILEETKILFEFTHDRVQQTAYSLIDDEKKIEIHYKLAKILQQRIFTDSEDNIFELVSHFNLALPLIQNEEEKIQVAKMNLEASRKAKNAATYTTAYDCIQIAEKLLGPNCWTRHYELAYQIYIELTECSYLTQRFENIDRLSQIILNNARTNLEKGQLYIIKIILYTNIAETQKALKEGLECLSLFGIHLKTNPSKFKIMAELLYVKWRLRKTPIASLEYLPKMTDPEKLFLMEVLTNLSTPAFITDKNLLCQMTLKMTGLILDYGVCDLSYFVYLSYGTLLNLLFRDYNQAYDLGELAIKTADKSNNNTYRCRANFIMASVINHWKNPLRFNEKFMHTCYKTGLESGEVMYTSFISVFWGFLEGSFFSNLTQALKNLRRYKNTIFSIKSKQPIHSFAVKESLILALQTPEFRGETISREDFSEMEYKALLKNDPELHVAYQAYVAYRMVLYFVFDRHKEALDLFEESSFSRKSIYALHQERELNVYHSLTLAELYPQATFLKKLSYWWKIKRNQKLLKKWAKVCPENNAHRFLLIEAELRQIRGDTTEALQYYDQSIELAHQYQHNLEEGIASELAGKMMLTHDKKFIAKSYLEHAYECYYRAGAFSKVNHLEEIYSKFLREKQSKRKQQLREIKNSLDMTLTTENISTSNKEGSSSLDLASVMQATTIISGAIHLETVLNELMTIVIENAGADRGFLIREVKGRWLLQAEKDINKKKSKVLQSIPFELETSLFSVIIIQYVIRTKQTVVLNDAVHMGMFTEDPYIDKYHPKSVLCFPVSHQGKLSSIIYLENNAATDAFTPRRLNILQLLSGQIATSIENATLYSNLEAASENLKAFNTQLEDYNKNLEHKVANRTKELQAKNEQLRDTLNTLKEMQKQVVQQEKLAALGSLTHGVAHEIKNPLNFINNFSSLSIELLQELGSSLGESISAKGKETVSNLLHNLNLNLSKIYDHSLRINGIILSMLKHSKETKGQKEAANINTLLQDYIALTTKIFTEKHPDVPVTIEKHLDSRLKTVHIIPQDIGRGIVNILENAFYAVNTKYELQKPSYTPTILVTSKQLNDMVEIRIKDNGFGIPKEHREKLFHPFFTTKPTGTGTGLGLSIAYDIIVHEHAGDIKMNSDEGHFTEFIITLPLQEKLKITQEDL